MGHLTPAAAVLAADPHCARLWAKAATRFRRRAPGELLGSIDLPITSAEQRVTINHLVDRPARGATARVDLDLLDTRLRSHVGATLRDLVEHVHGTIVDVHTQRAEAAASHDALASVVIAHPAAASHPALAERATAPGPLRASLLRLPRHHVISLLDIVAGIPYEPPVGRDVLAALHLADSHALDDSQPVGLALTAVTAAIAGRQLPDRAEARRDLLHAHGITTDAVSSRVHTLNIPGVGWAGEPTTVNLTNLVDPQRWKHCAGLTIWACENPTILQAAAHTYGADCPTMVCVDGNPTVAAQRLLAHLDLAEARIRYHGDLDAGGLRITATVLSCAPHATTWRMTALDYDDALAANTYGPPIKGAIPETPWDPSLRTSMSAHRVAVEEQHVLRWLLDDLRPTPARS